MTLISRRTFLTDGARAIAGLSALSVMAHGALAATGGADQPLRLGLIGVGSRGGGIATILQTLPGIEIHACCDILESHLQRGLTLAGNRAKGYVDYRKLLEDKRIDGVIITLPQYLHYPVAVAALEAGKHVYLEKTMTHDIPEAIELEKEVYRHSNLVFQVGHQYRYYALYHAIADILTKGWLGDVLQYECQYHRNSDWRRPVSDPKLERLINWRMYREYSGGLMTELCSHQIDIVNWLTNSHPLRVTAVGGIDYWKDGRETYDNIRAIFEYPNGIKANVSSILSNAYRGYSIRILGTKGTIEVQQSKAYLYSEAVKKSLATVDGVTGATADSWGQGKPVPVEFTSPDGEDRDPTAYALLGFAESIRTGKKPLANIETGKMNAIAVHLANKAADTGAIQEWV